MQGWQQRGLCRYYLYCLLKMAWMWCFVFAKIDIVWDYDTSSEGWVANEDTTMQWVAGSGLIIGSTTGLNPHIDSPTFSQIVGFQERTVVALRLRYLGKSERGRLDIRIGGHPGLEIGASQMVWGMELDKIPLIPKVIDSSNTLGMANVFDGDVTTAWTSNPVISGPQWLEFDLSAPYVVTKFGLVVDGTVNTPASVVLQWYYVSGKRWISVGFPVFLERIEGEQSFSITPTLSQYWRLRILSTHENDQGTGLGQVVIQELRLDGPMRSTAHAIEFNTIGDGKWHTYYVPIFESFQGTLSQLRFRPTLPGTGIVGQGWEIDFLHVAQTPRIDRVQGCIDRHYLSEREFIHQMGTLRAENIDQNVDGVLTIHETWFPPAGSVDATYSTTLNCPRSGGKEILIEGANFGENYPPRVTVGGRECLITQNVSQNAITCLIPPGNEIFLVNVQVSDSVLPGLFHSVPSLGYAQVPGVLPPLVVTNAASRSLDLSWNAESSNASNSSNEWEGGIPVTGYEVEVSAIGATNSNSDPIIVALGNVTTTTICGLHPSSTYSFRVRALVEPLDGDWKNVNLYGRRELVPGFLHGEFSEPSTGTTLEFDISIPKFTAQSTWNTTVPSGSNASVGPRGQWGPEGHYGLNLIESAHIEGCDLNTACCDGYPDCGANNSEFVCSGGVVAETNDVDSWVLSSAEGRMVDRACGPSLRITASVPGQAGATWYRRMQTVVEGFSTTFTFKLSSPSKECLVNNVHSKCRSKGGHGLAFVLQSESPVAIGMEGAGIGYEGIRNALIVEFDTVHNPEAMDPYENHISVLASGLDTMAQSHHSVSLGDSVDVPDLTSGIHTARIVYEPFFSAATILAGQVTSTWQVGRLMKQRSTSSGRLGMLSIYLDDNATPVMVAPINLEATIKLQHGRSFVGFTAATGSDSWQTHKILSWNFSSLRLCSI